MRNCLPRACVAIVFLLAVLSGQPAQGQSRMREQDEDFHSESFLLPYAFYNDNFGLALGGAWGVSGWPLDQSAFVLSPIVGSNGSVVVYFLGQDVQMPGIDRLFMDPMLSVGSFREITAYRDGNPNFTDERAGSNDSDSDNNIEGDGEDVMVRGTFKYLLPIGHGRDTIINTYVLDRGLPVSGFTGGDRWHPLESGRTYVEVQPFYRRQSVDVDGAEDTIKTNGLMFSLFHDNRDFAPDPSKGSTQRISLSRDFGWLDSTDDWTVLEAELSMYHSFEPTETFRKRTVALNFWTADTLSWDEDTVDGRTVVSGRAPSYAGATLGGVFRMRAYPSARYNDRAAIYYGAEYRVTPEWNPFDNAPDWLQQLNVDWVQFVGFAELGRVAEEWDLGDLHSDMKGDIGVGFRLMASHLVARVDLAVGDEGVGLQMMVGHPF